MSFALPSLVLILFFFSNVALTTNEYSSFTKDFSYLQISSELAKYNDNGYLENCDFYSYNVAATRLWDAISDAVNRYKILNKTDYIFREGKDFIFSLISLCEVYIPTISLHDDSMDVVLKDSDNNEYILNYDFDDSEVVFVSTFKKINGMKQLVIKDCKINELYDYMETI